ncbi:MAG: AI-2E family transporter, partial [Candidatus Nanohaloarchaea archaeon]
MKKEYVFLGGAALSGLIALLMLWPYADALLWAGFTAYLLHHVADRLDEYVQNRAVSTAIVLFFLIGFVSGVVYLMLTSIPTIADLLNQFSRMISGIVSLLVRVFDLPPELASSLQNIITEVSLRGRSWIVGRLSGVPGLLVHLVIYFVVSVFLVRDGKKFKRQTFEVIGKLPEYYRELAVIVIDSIDRLLRGVFLSYFAVALSVGLLASAGFYLMGLEFYWGWGLIIGIFAFFPIVSAPMVYVPLSLLYITLSQFWLGVMILVYGIVVLNTFPEVVLRPYLAAYHTEEHPVLLFVGFIVGPLVLGFKGIILGPIILVVAKNMLSMKYMEKHS